MGNKLQISVQETVKRLASDNPPRLLDTRESREWDIVHLPTAILVSPETIAQVLRDWPKETEIICYCHHGIRSLSVARYLADQGFTCVRSMVGGIDAWALSIDPELVRY